MEEKQKDWIESLKKNSEDELEKLYSLYKEEFVNWSVSAYKIRTEMAADIFQDAVITFYWNVKQEKLITLTSSIKTYLFAIGKNLALKKINKQSKMVVDNEVVEFNAAAIDPLPLESTDRQRLVAKLMNKIGEPCKSILQLFYFHRYSMGEIAKRLDYKNEHVVKSQKLRCLKKIKALLKDQNINKEDF